MADESRKWPLLLRLSRGLVAEQPDLAVQLAATIRAEVPFYGPGNRVPAEAVGRSAREHVAALVDRAAFPEGPETAPRALGERRARDGVELADVLDALRVGTSFLWRRIVDHARRTGAASDAELVDLASEVWMMHDAYVRTLTTGYREEHSRVLLNRQQERLGLVYGLLTARGREAASPWEAVDRLGLSRTEGFAVVAATTSAAGRMPLPRVERVLAETGTTSAWVMVADVQLGIVSTARGTWQEPIAAEAARWGTRVGVSPEMGDFARIGAAVRFSRIALATADAGTTSVFDHSPVAMAAAGSPEVTKRIVETVLDGLFDLSETDRDVLLDTLNAWFASNGSVAAVADRIGVHQNTVRNRIRRIAAVTGRDPLHPRDAAELYLALSGHRRTPGPAQKPGAAENGDR